MNGASLRPAQLPLGLASSSRASFENFIAGENIEALAAVKGLDAQAGDAIFLHGVAGGGKTHLLQAACRQQAAAGRRALYLSLTDTAASPPTLLGGLDDLDMLCVDDIDAMEQSGDWQIALLPLLDGVRARRGALLFAARDIPDVLDLRLPDLRSRLAWATRYRLRPLDDAGRSELLKRRAAERGLQMDDDVAAYLLQRAPRDVASLLKLLDQLDKTSLAEKRRLTIPLVRAVLQAG